MANKKLHTGDIVDDSGIYKIVGSDNEIVLTTGDSSSSY